MSLLDDDDVSSPPTPLSATPYPHPIPPSGDFLLSTPPLLPTQDLFTHIATTLLPALATLQGLPHHIIFLAPSRSLVDASITISMPIYAVRHDMEELEIEGDAGKETRSTSSMISHSAHSRLANACPVLQCVVFTNGVQWLHTSPSLPTLPHF